MLPEVVFVPRFAAGEPRPESVEIEINATYPRCRMEWLEACRRPWRFFKKALDFRRLARDETA